MDFLIALVLRPSTTFPGTDTIFVSREEVVVVEVVIGFVVGCEEEGVNGPLFVVGETEADEDILAAIYTTTDVGTNDWLIIQNVEEGLCKIMIWEDTDFTMKRVIGSLHVCRVIR